MSALRAMAANELGLSTFLDPEPSEKALGTGTTLAYARGVTEEECVEDRARAQVPKRSDNPQLCEATIIKKVFYLYFV
jgi:hypothetical protein